MRMSAAYRRHIAPARTYKDKWNKRTDENLDMGDTQQVTFQEMRSQIEKNIDDLIFRQFKSRNYDSKEA